jgi:hypothetical protein
VDAAAAQVEQVLAGWHGFQNFLKNGPRHLLASVQDWLLGGLAKAGLHLPGHLDLAGVIDLLLQVFNLTKAAVLSRLRQRLAAVLGAPNVGRVEELLAQVGGVALTLWQHGPAAVWQAISQSAGDLKAQALAFVQQQVLGVATRAVPVFLATLAVPGGAFLQVAKGIYSGVMTFVEKGRQIAQVGRALLGSVSAIAAGQLAPAAKAVETTLFVNIKSRGASSRERAAEVALPLPNAPYCDRYFPASTRCLLAYPGPGPRRPRAGNPYRVGFGTGHSGPAGNGGLAHRCRPVLIV